jgi:predicted secreted protein
MILHGKDLKITKSDDSTLVALARSCDINVDCDEIEVSSATTGKWRDFISGRLSWSITVNYLVTA